ncbi:hypothetical protein GO988_11985 [Hymenobacter sp. HMF4947]|uniref:Uncharacterized protein n=1 Tax=Hymenobacter ginkgonis TaxID=2682976 RepID=A0A7K1TF60_9BACT|nr:hypothetical protein [Hymenobacter ginkgonis]MVN77046.1 hypothetical protein [Hymenobacter ginkgonis]
MLLLSPVVPVSGIGFYLVLLVVAGLLFFGWRRLFGKIIKSEAGVLVATAIAAMVTTPLLCFGLLRLLVILSSR